MKRIQEGIHQIVTPFPEFQRAEAYEMRGDLESHPRVTRSLPYVLPYFIASRGETALIDCGWNTDDAYLALGEQLGEAGAGVGDVQKLVLTHAHPDHCGLSGRVKEASGCEIWMHELEVGFLESRYVAPEELLDRMDEWFGRLGVEPVDREEIERGSMPMRFFVGRFEPDTRLKGGETLKVGEFEFQLIWTPGHSPGHICLYEPNHQLLLSGDHVLPTITPNVSLHPQQRPNPLADFLESLETVAKLKVKRMLPAHEWDIDYFQRRIEELRGHHHARLEEMLEVLKGHDAMTAVDVAKEVRWSTGTYESFHGWMKRAAIGETLSHLVFMVGEGRLVQFEENGRLFFRPA